MKILDHLISSLNLEGSVKDIRQGVFHTAVLTKQCGLAATLAQDALRQSEFPVQHPGSLKEMTPENLASLAYSESILEAAIGMAAINSIIKINEDACRELNAADLIMEKGEGKRITIIGHFPFLAKVRQKAKDLWVIEKNLREGDFDESHADDLIPLADVVAITGTALTNHTLDRLLALCRPEAFVILLGGTAPLSPALFDFHIDAICGTKVVDANLALNCVSQGANFRQIKGTKRLTMLK
ncbi:MAG: DUF364 domain-containing protein [Desulfobacterales bacterium]|jgi:hypothetical protein|nr:DUF364 domain-containing protein [Desulfobacterales bacterium]